jgi:hypothetical protein
MGRRITKLVIPYHKNSQESAMNILKRVQLRPNRRGSSNPARPLAAIKKGATRKYDALQFPLHETAHSEERTLRLSAFARNQAERCKFLAKALRRKVRKGPSEN